MKKITILIIFTLISYNWLNAQSLLPVRYGIKAGTNIANIKSTPNAGVENIQKSSLMGFLAGFYIEIPLNDSWYINPELVFNQKGSSFTFNYIHDYETNQRDLHKNTNELKLGYIEINPTLSYKASSKLSLDLGPSISYLITEDYTTSDLVEDNDLTSQEILPDAQYDEETLDVGINIGISYYLSEDFLINGKINTGFISAGKISKITYTGSNGNSIKTNIYDIKNSGIAFNIAYLF